MALQREETVDKVWADGQNFPVTVRLTFMFLKVHTTKYQTFRMINVSRFSLLSAAALRYETSLINTGRNWYSSLYTCDLNNCKRKSKKKSEKKNHYLMCTFLITVHLYYKYCINNVNNKWIKWLLYQYIFVFITS